MSLKQLGIVSAATVAATCTVFCSPAQASGGTVFCDGADATPPFVGASCGNLAVGDSFVIDVTEYFAPLGDPTFDGTAFGVGAISFAGGSLGFTDVQAIVDGVAGGNPYPDSPIAIWAAAPDNPGGVSFYEATDPAGSFGAFQTAAFTFNAGGGYLGSLKAPPSAIGLTEVDSFKIVGILSSFNGVTTHGTAAGSFSFGVGDANGPGGIPFSALGGNFNAPVPGPLPILGLGAAFAWSRGLRQRISVAERAPATAQV